jgi:ribonuclease VapC
VSAIVIDTSVLMALLPQESDAEVLLDTAARAAVVYLSAASRLELGLVAESERYGVDATEVEQLLLTLRVEVVPFDHQQLH